MSLPFEVRGIFLEHLFPETTFAFFLRGTNGRQRTGIPLPPITLTTKQLRLESLKVAINRTEIEIHSGPGNHAFQNWLGNIDFSIHGDMDNAIINGFDAVKRLSFPYFSRFPHPNLPPDRPNDDIELMKKCPKLEEIKLNFMPRELWDPYEEREKTAVQLRGQYRLDGLLELELLEKVTLVSTSIAEDETLGIGALVSWLEEGFEKLGRKVEVGR